MFRARFGTPTALVAAGGVAANEAIRAVLQRVAFEVGTTLVVPPAELCTDNGAMIAWAGAERLALGLRDTLDTAPHPRWPLAEVRGPPVDPGEPPADPGEQVADPGEQVAAPGQQPAAHGEQLAPPGGQVAAPGGQPAEDASASPPAPEALAHD